MTHRPLQANSPAPAASLPQPPTPVQVALLGAGARMTQVYLPLLADLAPWLQVTAVCNRDPQRRAAMAEQLHVPAFGHVRELARAGVCEAVLVVLPPVFNHAVSACLSAHGLHHLVETPTAATLWQAQEMTATAQGHGVILRTAEHFFRLARDRMAALVREQQLIGPIRRILSYGSIVGFHTSARWRMFAGRPPTAVQSIEHTAPVHGHRTGPAAWHTQETYQARCLWFGDDLFVHDSCANRKGLLGRHPRDGYTEWHGERGTLVEQALPPTARLHFEQAEPTLVPTPQPNATPGVMTLRRCTGPFADPLTSAPAVSAAHEEQSPVTHEFVGGDWRRSYLHWSGGMLQHVNPLRTAIAPAHPPAEYAAAIMGVLVDFALAIRQLRASEFDAHTALDVMTTEAALRASAQRDGQRLQLPLAAPLESEIQLTQQLGRMYNTDIHDLEQMLDLMRSK